MAAADDLPIRLASALGAAYRVERELGGGGMSRIVLAEEVRFRRRVVVKVLAPRLAAGLHVDRFEREVRLAAALQNPHIVPVLSAGAVDGLPYYIMPFVDGPSLRARLRDAVPLAQRDAVAILHDVARALAHAHAMGVVHRDIKPENVLLAGDTAVVTDFGIAKALQASAAHAVVDDDALAVTLTELGTSLGTPAYMAPEQAMGHDADVRTDLYAWGMLAYELLAGRHPFASRTTASQLIAAQIGAAPAPLAAAAPGVPPALAGLVMRCVAKNPADRPASASELVAELRQWTGGTTTGEQADGAAARRWRRIAAGSVAPS